MIGHGHLSRCALAAKGCAHRCSVTSPHSFRRCFGHEFQAKFHWHVEDRGIRHAYIKPASPQLNGKVERSHRTDEQEFYQLLTYTGDVDLRAKLSEWEHFYNLSRPHGAFNGKAPYEVLRERL